MTGPEHYLEAERLLADPGNLSGRRTGIVTEEVAAHAQVHATLALAAATALSRREPGLERMAGCCRDEALWRCLLAAGPVLAGQVNACALENGD